MSTTKAAKPRKRKQPAAAAAAVAAVAPAAPPAPATMEQLMLADFVWKSVLHWISFAFLEPVEQGAKDVKLASHDAIFAFPFTFLTAFPEGGFRDYKAAFKDVFKIPATAPDSESLSAFSVRKFSTAKYCGSPKRHHAELRADELEAIDQMLAPHSINQECNSIARDEALEQAYFLQSDARVSSFKTWLVAKCANIPHCLTRQTPLSVRCEISAYGEMNPTFLVKDVFELSKIRQFVSHFYGSQRTDKLISKAGASVRVSNDGQGWETITVSNMTLSKMVHAQLQLRKVAHLLQPPFFPMVDDPIPEHVWLAMMSQFTWRPYVKLFGDDFLFHEATSTSGQELPFRIMVENQIVTLSAHSCRMGAFAFKYERKRKGQWIEIAYVPRKGFSKDESRAARQFAVPSKYLVCVPETYRLESLKHGDKPYRFELKFVPLIVAPVLLGVPEEQGFGRPATKTKRPAALPIHAATLGTPNAQFSTSLSLGEPEEERSAASAEERPAASAPRAAGLAPPRVRRDVTPPPPELGDMPDLPSPRTKSSKQAASARSSADEDPLAFLASQNARNTQYVS